MRLKTDVGWPRVLFDLEALNCPVRFDEARTGAPLSDGASVVSLEAKMFKFKTPSFDILTKATTSDDEFST